MDEINTSAVLAERARLLAVGRERVEVGEPHVVVAASGTKIAIPMNRVRQVNATGPRSRLPRSGSGIAGITSAHGALVPVADLGDLIAGQPRTTPSSGLLLLLDDGGSALGLLVDAVEGVLSLAPGELLTEASQNGAPPGLIAGLGAGGVLFLDVDALLADPRLSPVASTAGPTHQDETSGGMSP